MSNDKTKKNQPKDWHSADIIAALRKKNMSLSLLAHKHGLTSATTLSAALTRSYPKNEKRIADALGVLPQVIWPSRYYPDGSKRPRGARSSQLTKCSKTMGSCNVKESDGD